MEFLILFWLAPKVVVADIARLFSEFAQVAKQSDSYFELNWSPLTIGPMLENSGAASNFDIVRTVSPSQIVWSVQAEPLELAEELSAVANATRVLALAKRIVDVGLAHLWVCGGRVKFSEQLPTPEVLEKERVAAFYSASQTTLTGFVNVKGVQVSPNFLERASILFTTHNMPIEAERQFSASQLSLLSEFFSTQG